MDAHDPEPLASKPNKICNKCNEHAEFKVDKD